MEFARCKAGQPINQTASKLSAVKWKGTNPKWQPKQQQSDKKDDEESEKKPCAHGCHSGCKVKKCQAKQADNYKEDEEAESSQLASSAFLATPAFTTITGCGAVIPLAQPKCLNQSLTKRLEPQLLAQHIMTERAIQDPCKRMAPQDFSGSSIGEPSVYKEHQQAWDTLTNINLPKSVHNLHPLEIAFTACTEGKKRQKNISWLNFTLSPPPTSIIEEVDNEDMISLGSDVQMMEGDIWDLVNEHLGPDMMDLISFGTFNKIRLTNWSVFPSQNCTHDTKVLSPAPFKIRQLEGCQVQQPTLNSELVRVIVSSYLCCMEVGTISYYKVRG